MAGCRSPSDCITGHICAIERPEEPGRYKMPCPICGGEMSIEPGTNRPLVFRCHRNRGHDQVQLHKKMVEIFGRDCIAGRKNEQTLAERQVAELKKLLSSEPRSVERDLHMAEVLYQRKIPTDWEGFIEFAGLAGVPSSTAYKLAGRHHVQPRRT